MAIPAGTYDLTPEHADLLLKTYTEGAAAAMGHNLTLRVGSWSATVDVGASAAESHLLVTADLTSIEVIGGSGGATPLTASNKRDICKNAAKSLGSATHPQLTFTSTGLSGNWADAVVSGELTAHGQTHPVQLVLDEPEPGTARLHGSIVQSDFGIKPFSTMLGTLRLRDAVDVEVEVAFSD
ncbi:MAG: YceI family protein [Tetrasphaera sp.]